MYKLAGQAVDVTDDPSLVDESKAPAHIKKASANLDYENLSSKDFALIIGAKSGRDIPKYPINDPYNTWAANESFSKTAHLLSPKERVVAANFIKKACNKYYIDVDSTVEKISSAFVPNTNRVNWFEDKSVDTVYLSEDLKVLLSEDIEKTAKQVLAEKHRSSLSDKDFGLVINGENKYPLFNRELTKEASQYFADYHKELDPKQRREFASKIASKARKFKLTVDKSVEKYAGSEYSEDIETNIQVRKDMTHDVKTHRMYDILLEKKASISASNFADTLYSLDKKLGMSNLWDNYVPDPYASVLEKTAERLESYLYDMGDYTINGLDLGKLAENPDILAGYLAPEIITTFQKNPRMVFESLPRPQKSIIGRAIKGDLERRASGQQPASRKSEVDEITRGEASPKDISLKTPGLVDDYAASKMAARDLMMLTDAQKKRVNPESDSVNLGPESAKVKIKTHGLINTQSSYAGQYPSKTAAILQNPGMPTGPKKELLGKKALRPILPVGSKVTGVQTSNSKLVDKPTKFASKRIKDIVERLKKYNVDC